MKEIFEEHWSCLQCGQCKWFNVNADREESNCKRLDHKHLKLAVPFFKSYDCGQYFGTVCREFEPADWCIWLKAHWISYDDYYGGDNHVGHVYLVIDGDSEVRYGVRAEDFINGTFLNDDGSLKWRHKSYYKHTRNSPTGYELVFEMNDSETSKEKDNNEPDSN